MAIEVTKYVEGTDGESEWLLSLPDNSYTNNIHIYEGAENVHDKEIEVGVDGIGQFYDYDVTGGTYSHPKYWNISEDPDSVPDEIIDANGNSIQRFKATFAFSVIFC